MWRTFAFVASYIFHPLWMPLIIFFVALFADPYFFVNRDYTGLVGRILVVNILAPAFSIWLLIRKKMLSNIELMGRRERSIPYIIVFSYYLFTYLFLRSKHMVLSPELVSMILAVCLSLLIAFLINLKWKISVHMLSQGGMVGCLLALNEIHVLGIGNLVMIFLLIAGWVGFSRIYLGAHTHGQVYAGFLLGGFLNYVLISTRFII